VTFVSPTDFAVNLSAFGEFPSHARDAAATLGAARLPSLAKLVYQSSQQSLTGTQWRLD
jgi:hypothetical protein